MSFFIEVLNPTGTIRHPNILEEAGIITIIGIHSNATSPLLTTTDRRSCTKFNKSPWRIARAPHKEVSRILSYRIDKAVESYYMELSTSIWSKSFFLALRDDFKIPHKHNWKANKFLRKLFLSVHLLQNDRLIKSEGFKFKLLSLQKPSICFSNNCLIVWSLFKNT